MSDMSERQFAAHVGAALSTVQDRRKAGLLPKSARQDGRGRWRIDRVAGLEEWEAFAPLRVAPGDEDSLRRWREARARREAALAALAEDQLRKSRGELVEAAGVEAAWTTIVTQSRNKLLGIPSRARQQLPHLTLSDIATLDALIREALEELANSKEETNGNE